MKKKLSLALAFVMLFVSVFGTSITSFASTKIDEAIVVSANKPVNIQTKYDGNFKYRLSHCWIEFTPKKTATYAFEIINDDPKDEDSMLVPLAFPNKESAKKLDLDSMLEVEGVEMGDLEDEDDMTMNYMYKLEEGHKYYIDICVANFENQKAEPSATLTIRRHIHEYEPYVLEADMDFDGEKGEMCKSCYKERNTKVIPSIKSVNLSYTSCAYNGKKRTPTVTIKDRKGKVLERGKDYTVTYPKKATNVGKYTVKIKFKGDYYGTVKKTYKVNPKKTSITKVTAKSKGFKVKWSKRTTQNTGYQIQYSTSSSFKNAKTKTVSNKSTVSKDVTGLKAGKKYYVRVRTYKTVNGTKYYSSWSSKKSVVTKK